MNSKHVVEVLRRMRNEWPLATDEGPAMDAAITALSAPNPEGEWVLVPREPTPEMLSAAHYELADKPFSNNAERSARAYAAMLAAAQRPAAAGEMAELVGLLDEVRSHFTRDDDLPDDLLPRIDAALRWIAGGES